ncbi:MAG: DUF3794 domain-containing protein [Clostridia bacterium]|nr:DUF3794 domain-containing protein [Clostridia bacterium]
MKTEYGELQVATVGHYEDEVLVETTADASERGGATKVLSLEAEVKAASAELLDGEAEVTGKVNYRLLYLDRQDRLCGLDYFKDFKCRVKGEGISPSGKCALRFTVPDQEATLRGDEIALSAMVGVALDCFGEKSEQVVTAVEGAESKKGAVISERVTRSERTIELEKVVDSGPSVKKIVLFGVDAILSKAEQKEGGNELVGEVRANILYLNEADEAVEVSATIPFCETVGEGAAEYAVSVKNARIVLTDDEGGGVIEVEVAVCVEQLSHEVVETEVVTAAVGETGEAVERLSKVGTRRYLGQIFSEETLTGTIPRGEGGFVAFVRPGCHAIADVAVVDGAVKVEGVAAFQAACLADGKYTAVQGELPFSYLLPLEGAAAGQSAEARFTITDAKGTMTTDGIVITAKVWIAVTIYEDRVCSFLSDVTEGDPYPESGAGISVYFAEKGEDAWSIAKAMKVLPSALVEANPFLEGALEEDKRILILRKK